MKQINSHDYENIYKELNIDLDDLGCIMLNIENLDIPQYADPDYSDVYYYTKDPKKFWIKGPVASQIPHITLLYGLLKPGPEWKKYVDEVLKGWDLATVKVDTVDYFESPYGDAEPYYCIVAHIEITPKLLEGHQRLELLPHINTFFGYKAHLTLAYIKKDFQLKEKVVQYYYGKLAGKELRVTGIDYGGKK